MKAKDVDILNLLNARDERALGLIKALYGKLLFSLAYKITGCKEDSEEAVSDTLLDIWNTVPPEKPLSIVSYAAAITRRRAVDTVRNQTAKKRKNPDFIQTEAEFSSDFNEWAIVNSMVISQITDSFLRSLSKDDRFIFLCRYFEYADLSQISKLTGLSQNTVAVKLFRMRASLKELLEAQGIDT